MRHKVGHVMREAGLEAGVPAWKKRCQPLKEEESASAKYIRRMRRMKDEEKK